MLQMMILPLVTTSMISGCLRWARTPPRRSVCGHCCSYMCATTLFAVIIGIVLSASARAARRLRQTSSAKNVSRSVNAGRHRCWTDQRLSTLGVAGLLMAVGQLGSSGSSGQAEAAVWAVKAAAQGSSGQLGQLSSQAVQAQGSSGQLGAQRQFSGILRAAQGSSGAAQGSQGSSGSSGSSGQLQGSSGQFRAVQWQFSGQLRGRAAAGAAQRAVQGSSGQLRAAQAAQAASGQFRAVQLQLRAAQEAVQGQLRAAGAAQGKFRQLRAAAGQLRAAQGSSGQFSGAGFRAAQAAQGSSAAAQGKFRAVQGNGETSHRPMSQRPRRLRRCPGNATTLDGRAGGQRRERHRAAGDTDAAAAVDNLVPHVENVWAATCWASSCSPWRSASPSAACGERGHVARQFFDGCSEAVLVVVKVIIRDGERGGDAVPARSVLHHGDQRPGDPRLSSCCRSSYLIVVRRNPFRYMFGCMRAILTCLVSTRAPAPATLLRSPVLHRGGQWGQQNGKLMRVARGKVSLAHVKAATDADKMFSGAHGSQHHVFCVLTTRCRQKSHCSHSGGVPVRAPGRCHHQHGRHRLYEAVASVFIAQLNGITPGLRQAPTAAAVGAAGVPEAGPWDDADCLTAVGLPTDDLTGCARQSTSGATASAPGSSKKLFGQRFGRKPEGEHGEGDGEAELKGQDKRWGSATGKATHSVANESRLTMARP
uniref:Protein kinase domain-containing protein n=1 Tax=Macrostomum lignano TaxID=282301 RepID=A0A1I8JPF6_9PLAT